VSKAEDLRQQFAGKPRELLPTPALLVDERRLMGNLQKMAAFFAAGPTRLRPHAKSHKCSTLARLQVEAGAIGITCATVQEAEAMVAGGVRDILIANQVVNDYWLQRLLTLAGKCDLKVAADAEKNLRQLSRAASAAGVELGILVEVNVGMGRCGIDAGPPACALATVAAQLPGLRWRGFMGYEGHVVGIHDRQERFAQCRQAMTLLTQTVDLAREQGLVAEIVSAGGTGTYEAAGRFPGVTEVQAGSYALMDLAYRRVLTDFECALTVLATVISRPTPDRAIGDAGLKSMSTEFGLPEVAGNPGVALRDLSEEHSIFSVAGAHVTLAPGDKVELLPSHGCTTVALHPYLYLMRDGRVHDVWAVDGRGGG
jgi:D-serine deaminase-like pyridoxal phosphate-dependent protein